jgi:hypothetical protein
MSRVFNPAMRRLITGTPASDGDGTEWRRLILHSSSGRGAHRPICSPLDEVVTLEFSVGAIAARNGAFPSLLRHVIDLTNHLLALHPTI